MIAFTRPIERRGGYRQPKKLPGVVHALCSKPGPSTECVGDTDGWIRNESDRLAVAEGCWFDAVMGGYAVWWIERYMRLYEGRWAGEPAVMHGCKECRECWVIPREFNAEFAVERAQMYAECVQNGHETSWQYDFLMRLFGWLRYSEQHQRAVRRFKKFDVWIPKKNMKSPTLAFLGWHIAIGDGEPGQKLYFGAKDGAQAKEIVGNHAVAAFEMSEELQSCIRHYRNEMKFEHEPTRSQMKPLSSSNQRTTKAKEGLNGSLLVDEVHVVDEEFIKRVKRMGISRIEPIMGGFSTAGLEIECYGKRRQDYGRRVAAGEVEDSEYLFICYEADQTIDMESLDVDEAVKIAKRCNPAWGITIDEREFRSDFLEAKNATIDELLDVGTYRFNIWQFASAPWLRAASWARCGQDYTLDDLKGKPCTLGIDLSRCADLTAVVFVFDLEDGRRRLWPMFWIPENTARRHQTKVADFHRWRNEGHIYYTTEDTIDQAQVLAQIQSVMDVVDCRGVYYDPAFAEPLTQKLVEDNYCDRTVFNQSMSCYAAPTEMFEEEVLSGVLAHPEHPVLTWQALHCHVQRNKFTEHKRPVKPSDDTTDPRTVDGVQAAVMGYTGHLVDQDEYDGRLLVV